MNQEDKQRLNSLIEEIKLVEGKYQEPMLWKKGNQKLWNNYEAARRRIKPLQRRLQRIPKLLRKYKQTIDNYIKQGYARELTEEEKEEAFNRLIFPYVRTHPRQTQR